MNQTKPQIQIEDLNKWYSEAELVDSEIFSEMRSNILLVTGDHYAKKDSKYWSRIRDSRDLTQETKLRLTKNHIQKITKGYTNNIINMSPGVRITPKNEKEIQDQKDAELNQSVWEDLKQRHKARAMIRVWCKDFIDVGEVHVKCFWNPFKGKLVAYKQAVTESGEPVTEEDGSPSKGTPVFSGDIEFETVLGPNLLRDANAKTMESSRILCIRKMSDVKDLKKMLEEFPEKLKFIEEGKDETYVVFTGTKKGYSEAKGQCLVREYYWRPCMEFPNGYFAITTKLGILFEGELPFGIFPIISQGFDTVQTSPRCTSIVKVLRPYQAEINRTASKVAEHQTTLGDDKLIVQAGSKLTNGGQLPGVRAIQVSGAMPTILQGRDGGQFVGHMQQQIDEMYNAASFNEDKEEKGQTDPFASLFASMRDKKKFSAYAEKFEDFLIDICKTSLELAKNYYPDDMIVPAIGKPEAVNIAEFKSTTPISYSIKLEPMSDDIESIMGRQLTINHALQYVGGQLDKKDIGKMIRNMPFGNFKEAFSDLTIDEDSAVNMILALDRGEQPQPSKYDDESYMIKKLIGRMRMADFKSLHPFIQQNYAQLVDQYEQIGAQKMQEIKQAESQLIPSGGARVKADLYIQAPKDPSKVEKATFPAESLQWLLERLAEQGSSQEQMALQNQGAVAEMAAKFNQATGQMGAQSQMPGANGGNVIPLQQ